MEVCQGEDLPITAVQTKLHSMIYFNQNVNTHNLRQVCFWVNKNRIK